MIGEKVAGRGGLSLLPTHRRTRIRAEEMKPQYRTPGRVKGGRASTGGRHQNGISVCQQQGIATAMR
jgi:hypothetical protein